MSNNRTSQAINRLQEIMAILRSPGGCPWDAGQTPESLRPYLIEEAYEVLQAIDQGDPEAICEELGDLLLQVVFHSRIFEERGKFDLGCVAESISNKLIRRHPHVFAGDPANDPETIARRWEEIKERDKPPKREPFADIPRQLPALLRARKVTSEAVRAGLEFPDTAAVTDNIRQRLNILAEAIRTGNRLDLEQQIGAILFAVAGLGHLLNLEPEEILRLATERFCRDFDQRP